MQLLLKLKYYFFLMVLLVFSGCANEPQLYEVKGVYICAAEECSTAGQKVSSAQLLNGLQKLLQANEGVNYRYCDSNNKTRSCKDIGLGYMVLEGALPGKAFFVNGRFSQVNLNKLGQFIEYGQNSELFINATHLTCSAHKGKINIRSVDEITLIDDEYACKTKEGGTFNVTYNFAVESIDFDRGRIGGYWAHSIKGVGVGGGKGYGIIELRKPMPKGENWLE